MNANEDDEDKNIDSVTISLFILYLYHTYDLTNRESDTIPNNKSNYEISSRAHQVGNCQKGICQKLLMFVLVVMKIILFSIQSSCSEKDHLLTLERFSSITEKF